MCVCVCVGRGGGGGYQRISDNLWASINIQPIYDVQVATLADKPGPLNIVTYH